MLKSIVLENFKAFGQRTVIPLAPITLIYGQNSAGKSSILQALSLLKQSRENRDSQALLLPRTDNGQTDLGSFREMVFDHDLSRALKIRLSFAAAEVRTDKRVSTTDIFSGLEKGIEFAFCAKSPPSDVALTSIDFCSASVAGHVARFVPGSPKSQNSGSWFFAEDNLDGPNRTEYVFSENGRDADEFWRKHFQKLIASKNAMYEDLNSFIKDVRRLASGRDDPQQGIPDSYKNSANEPIDKARKLLSIIERSDMDGFVELAKSASKYAILRLDGFLPITNAVHTPDSKADPVIERMRQRSISYRLMDAGWLLGEYSVSAGQEVQRALMSMSSMGPLRRPPERWYVYTGRTPRHVGYQGNLLPDLLFRKQELIEQTNHWLERLDLGYQLEVTSLGANASDLFEMRLLDMRRGSKVSVALRDVGFGISQILPLIVQSLIGTDQILTIEQPEVHIHPKLQADLGDLIAHAIHASRNNQFLIETHSEHLALRVMKLIRTQQLRAEDVSILYVQRGRDGSKVLPIRIDSDGDLIDDFPGGFFPERLNEL